MGSSTHTVIESPDYAEIHGDIFAQHCKANDYDDKLMSIKCNLEDLDSTYELPRFDRVFSMNCFEHIMELGRALSTLFERSSDDSYIYSTFYPIFSFFDWEIMEQLDKYKKDNPGLHHYPISDQRKAVKKNFPEHSESEIMECLAGFNFNKKD